MPTIIALDVSLSMTRAVPAISNEENLTYHQLAVQAINQLLNNLAATSKLEYVSLIIYSSRYDVVVDFTRDYDVIRQALYNVEHYDKTCLGNVLQAASSMILSNWGTQNYCQVLVFTHCGIGLGPTSVPQLIEDLKAKALLSAKSTPNQTTSSPQKSIAADSVYNCDWIPFSDSSKLSFICLGHTTDTYFQQALKMYQEFVDVSAQYGQLFVAASDASDSTKKLHKNVFGGDGSAQLPTIAQWKSDIVPQLIDKMCEINYKRFEAVLKCGGYHKLEAAIIIWPPPKAYTNKDTDVPRQISRKIEICGFLNLADIGSPMSISRHIILPNDNPTTHFAQAEKLEKEIKSFFTRGDDDDALATESNGTEANKESVCVLLHGALKFENTAALVLLNNDDWYGFIYSYADSKRKSNLMMTILPPGYDVVPWLGDFRYFGTVEDSLPGENLQFPVKPEKRSYSQNCVVWIKQAGLQSDIQKVLRHAKKLPEKTQQFYKELNRIRRAALSLGFIELLEVIATLFEQEILTLPLNVSPDCNIQLSHAASQLRKVTNRDLKITITPLPTKFNQLL